MKDKINNKFDNASNTTQMVKDFVEIIKTAKGNTNDIKECFKAVEEYCKNEPYYDHLRESIIRQVDVDMLGTTDISDVAELF